MPDDLDRWAVEICPSDPIDRGIVRALKLLIDAGFQTFEACEGGVRENGHPHAYAEPTVRFEGDASDALRAVDVCLAAGLLPRRAGVCWQVDRNADPPELLDRERPFCEIAFRTQLD
jgi:hypothetical protein